MTILHLNNGTGGGLIMSAANQRQQCQKCFGKREEGGVSQCGNSENLLSIYFWRFFVKLTDLVKSDTVN